mmetsp:Transcript_62041/g.147837  ORF Transcript_62041/g.147837 Transcript_62041/m.147837 type:complete len:311 (+) Transcript_62041:1470-2402(+)
MARPAASPATALSEKRTTRRSSYSSSLPEAIPARPRPRHAPCWIVSLLLALRSASERYLRMPSPWLAWISPSAYSAPPSEKGEDEIPGFGRYSFITFRELLMHPLCIMPTHAVAENLAQFVARFSQSMFSVTNVSTVVPQCMTALAKTVAWWVTALRASIDALMLLRRSMSVLLLRYRNSRLIPIDVSPVRISLSFATLEARSFSAALTGSAAASFISVSPPASAPASPASAPIMASVMLSGSTGFSSSGFGSAFRTSPRKCCMSLSQRSNAIWYAMISWSTSPLCTSSPSSPATAVESSRSIQHCETCW